MNAILQLQKPAGWHERRVGKITGSMAGKIMRGGEEAFNLWLELTGQREPDDLSNVLIVQMGSYLEEFICDWFTKETGFAVTRRNDWVVSASDQWRACEIDGYVEAESAVMDAKFTAGREDPDEHFARYLPQITHNATVCGAERAGLVVLTGYGSMRHRFVDVDPFYAAELIEREREFFACVESKTAPPGWEPVAAPVAPSEWKDYDLTGNNAWAAAAADWTTNRAAADTFKKAEKSIKELVPADAGSVTGHGIIVKRDKANRLGIKEAK